MMDVLSGFMGIILTDIYKNPEEKYVTEPSTVKEI